MESKRMLQIVMMIEAAFMAAFSLVLDLLPSIQLSPFISISFAMIPIFIISLRWGMKAGMISGFVWGLLQVVTGDYYFLHVIQFVVEYFIAFACIGLAGLFYPFVQTAFAKGKLKTATSWIVVAVFVGSLARYFWHFIAGIVFWGSFAPEGMSPVIYSLIVNGGTMVGSGLLCTVLLIILIKASSRLIMRKQVRSSGISISK